MTLRAVASRLDVRAPALYWHVKRREYLAHRDGARTFSGTRLTDPDVLRAQEPWLERWVASGLPLRDAMDAAEIVTSYVVGFMIEEQERTQSAASDPERYALVARDAALGADAPLVAAAGHDRNDVEARFARQLEAILAGLAAS